jgi:hypothetical protein
MARPFLFSGPFRKQERSRMGNISKSKKAPERKSASRKPAKTGKRGMSRAARMVERVLGSIEEKIQTDQLKPTVGDYLRLLQFREEMHASEPPKEIKVTWIDSTEATSESEK